MSDNVNNPQHYNHGRFECLDVIEDVVGAEGFKEYLRGNIFKYLWRYQYKNGIEDLKKARFYLDRLIGSLDKEE